ncbi:hypothetical protein NQZ79_g1604 [Umbelopsis isabellina]|nr:hypothetical protein NQZ79_g1604 [Umbelopsis isabellina]
MLLTRREYNEQRPQGRRALDIINLLCDQDDRQRYRGEKEQSPPSDSATSSPETPCLEYLEPPLLHPSISEPCVYRHTKLPFLPELSYSQVSPPPSPVSLPSIMELQYNTKDISPAKSYLEPPFRYQSSFQNLHFGEMDAIRFSQILKAKRKRANAYQLDVLNRVFDKTFFPSTELRTELGKQLGMSPRTVQIWFQNKRQSIRTRQRTAVEHQLQFPTARYM